MGNLDKRRSIMEAIKRSARAGEPGFHGLSDDDLRFKVWEHKTRPESAAVVIAMRDASGSMGEFKKYLTRSLFFWLVRFLRTKYTAVEIVLLRPTSHQRHDLPVLTIMADHSGNEPTHEMGSMLLRQVLQPVADILYKRGECIGRSTRHCIALR